MNICDLAPPYIRAISPYQPGKPISELAREMGMDERTIIKLASNENPLGTSPLAREAMKNTLEEVSLYPDGSGFELKAALSRRYGVASEQIVLGNGSNDVLELAARVFLKPGGAAVYSQHAFAVYPLVTQAVGASGISVRAMNYGHDLDAMLHAITPETRVVFIANPNNPTGTLLAAPDLLRFLERISPDVLVVLDEAYNEYLPNDIQGHSIGWLKRFGMDTRDSCRISTSSVACCSAASSGSPAPVSASARTRTGSQSNAANRNAGVTVLSAAIRASVPSSARITRRRGKPCSSTASVRSVSGNRISNRPR